MDATTCSEFPSFVMRNKNKLQEQVKLIVFLLLLCFHVTSLGFKSRTSALLQECFNNLRNLLRCR